MKIVKTAYQSQNERGVVTAHETAYIIKGLFRRKVYRVDTLAVVELPTIKKVRNEKEKS